ncbi:MAG: DinB family protein [bacterium]
MLKRERHETQSNTFKVAVERGRDGFTGAWAMDLPGCFALVSEGQDLAERMCLAVLEYTAWSHQRSADRLTIDRSQFELVQSVVTEAQPSLGESTAFFMHDAEPVNPREFPVWANAHDRAVDELKDLVGSLPASLGAMRLDSEGRSLIEAVHHVAETERDLARVLKPTHAPPSASGREEPLLRELLDAHIWLQQTVCDVRPDARFRQELHGGGAYEEFSVRKVMRRSIWHVRHHTWDIRKTLSGLWIP